ncbi:MAG: FliA/WhiG family RNA polymerase sigma factor [Syntrophales bacterium]|nr:FliA/WhiG family RNA polymerase sigma factor [Syntrophales bacterium]
MSIDKQTREKLILQYAPMVKTIVNRMTARLPMDLADKESLVNAGIIGLMSALDKFDESKNVPFDVFAKFRIRGAVLDELRANDWIPRSVRHKEQKVEKAINHLRQTLKREPTEEEISVHLGLSIEEYYELLDEAKLVTLLSAEDLSSDYIDFHVDEEWLNYLDRENPLDLLESEELRRLLKNAIDSLPEKERIVLSLYYYEEMTMKEIGAVLKITESRVCQIHSQAIIRLRSHLLHLRETVSV